MSPWGISGRKDQPPMQLQCLGSDSHIHSSTQRQLSKQPKCGSHTEGKLQPLPTLQTCPNLPPELPGLSGDSHTCPRCC